jgi:8-oxo-dGTP pyrophosphatase MutT (NUDIX family)
VLIDTSADPSNPRDSATVVLLREGATGPEVFLLQRSGLSDAFGKAYVFPGGKLDAHDSAASTLGALDTPADALAQQLGEPTLAPALAAGLFVAGLRELFEEAGVLLSSSSTRPGL